MLPTELRRIIVEVMPRCREPGAWASALSPPMEKYGIATDKDYVAAFLAQIAVESAEMNILEENLSYSPERLRAVWPSRFPTKLDAAPFAHSPEKLANQVYGGRMGNGPVVSGDGYKFRGRGLKMVTGKDNYRKLSLDLGYDLLADPDLLLEKDVAATTAAAYWGHPEDVLSRLANDLPDDDDSADFVSITRKINGGVIGLAQRRQYWERAKRALRIV